MIQLIQDAKYWHKFWSIRLALLSAILGALELALPLWQGLVPPHTFAVLSTLAAVGAAVARVIQQNLEGRDV